MYTRHLYHALQSALGDARVVLLNGARQTGKSTLARQVAEERGGQYLTLDDPATRALATSDPGALIETGAAFTVIDEVQYAPALFPAIKRAVDTDPRPGRFLLTGSANVFLVPKLAESLAGRMEILPLHPLSQAEMGDSDSNLVDRLFDAHGWRTVTLPINRIDVANRIVAGGFPEAVTRSPGERRDAWFRGYVASILQRDIRDLAHIEGLTDMPRLLSLLAARPSALMNMSEVSRASGIAHSTLRRYLSLLEATFLLQPLPAWSTNIGKRLVKSPKIHLLDTGLTAHLAGLTDTDALTRAPALGPMLESFVVQEIRKHLAWSRQQATAWHYRSAAGQEVDLVLEAPGQRIVGVEIKATANISAGDFSGLRALADTGGEKFVCGVLFYLGENVLPFGNKLWAVPVSAFWQQPAGQDRFGIRRKPRPPGSLDFAGFQT